MQKWLGYAQISTTATYADAIDAEEKDIAERPRRIGALYEIEQRVRGKPPDERLGLRQAESNLLVVELRDWFEAQMTKLTGRSPTARQSAMPSITVRP